jgi:hypothetical protein
MGLLCLGLFSGCGNPFGFFFAQQSNHSSFSAPTTYTLSYNSNGADGGSLPASTNSYTSGATVTVLGNTGVLVRSGYVFACWNTQSDGSGASYAGGGTLHLNSSLTLYSVWVPNTVNVNASGFLTGFSSQPTGAYTVPSGVMGIGENAFQSDTGLTSVTIPTSVTTLDAEIFLWDTSLTTVNLPSTLTSIGSGTFEGCTGLSNIVLPNGLTTIGTSAFSGCTALTSIVLPSTVTSLGDQAFANCTGLTSVTIQNPVPPTLGGGNVFMADTFGAFHVPAGSVSTYAAAWSGSTFVGY